MPSDFGDESGEKLFDWILRVGQDATESALLNQAEKLRNAFRNARGEIDPATESAIEGNETSEWAKLKLAEFESLPEYSTIKEIIEKKLDAEKIEHEFFADKDGHDYLLFRISDAPDVSQAFSDLEKQTDVALDKALKSRGLTRNQVRDAEPIEIRAQSARESAKALEAARETSRDIELSQGRAK